MIALLCSCKVQPGSKVVASKPEVTKVEQAVIVYLKLSNSEHGTEQEREMIFKLETELEKKIVAASAGEVDGNEFGEGFVTLYMYGPDANKLFESIRETIAAHKPRDGSYVIKRYGKPGAQQEKIDL